MATASELKTARSSTTQKFLYAWRGGIVVLVLAAATGAVFSAIVAIDTMSTPSEMAFLGVVYGAFAVAICLGFGGVGLMILAWSKNHPVRAAVVSTIAPAYGIFFINQVLSDKLSEPVVLAVSVGLAGFLLSAVGLVVASLSPSPYEEP